MSFLDGSPAFFVEVGEGLVDLGELITEFILDPIENWLVGRGDDEEGTAT